MLPADNCNQAALLLAVQLPIDNSSTLPLPAALPTVTEEDAKVEITFVRVNFTLKAFTLAVTVNVPPMLLAVSVGAVAIPLALVRIGMGGVALNVPLAPPAPGVTVNVTATPGSGMPLKSVTVTCSGAEKAWLAGAL